MNEPMRLAEAGLHESKRAQLRELLTMLELTLVRVDEARAAIASGREARRPREECIDLDCLLSGDCQSLLWQCRN